jgi:hypothetical protein
MSSSVRLCVCVPCDCTLTTWRRMRSGRHLFDVESTDGTHAVDTQPLGEARPMKTGQGKRQVSECQQQREEKRGTEERVTWAPVQTHG